MFNWLKGNALKGKRVVVKRPVGGVSGNSLESLLDDRGKVFVFDDVKSAKDYLFRCGYDEQQIKAEGIVFMAA